MKMMKTKVFSMPKIVLQSFSIKRGDVKHFILDSSKKGQFFLIVAVIIILLLYSLTINYNYIRESIELKDYGELKDNYNRESPKVLNNAIFITTDPSKCKDKNSLEYQKCPLYVTQQFAKQYQQYANQKDPNFGLVSIIRDPVTGNIIIQNLLAGDNSYIQIKPNNYQGDITLLSENTQSKGTITLNGIGQLSVSTPVSSFSEGLTQADIGKVDSFKVCLNDGSCQIISSTLSSRQLTYSQSQNRGTVNVDICPAPNPDLPNNC